MKRIIRYFYNRYCRREDEEAEARMKDMFEPAIAGRIIYTCKKHKYKLVYPFIVPASQKERFDVELDREIKCSKCEDKI